jgi:beta-barrel assembly-enhancing protease
VNRRSFFLGCCGCALPAAATAQGDEAGLWAYMAREEERLRRSPFLIRDEALNTYVRDIACRLAGDHCPDVRIYLVRQAHFNATMAPNGMLQVWSGLLLRMANEAQLAAILGHEIGHFVARHGVARLREAKKRTAVGQTVGLGLTVFGWLGVAVNSVAQLALSAGGAAYSREHEREADRIGLELMERAGYAPIEASRVWAQLFEEVQADPNSMGGNPLFETHPAAEEREQLLAAAAGAREGYRGAEAYARILAPHRAQFLRDEILRGHYSETLVLLDRLPSDGEVLFYKGEAHRLRGDMDEALAAYRSAENPPAELYRSMGLVLRRRGDAAASQAFARYLELRPGAPDAELIRSYL